MAEPNKSLAPKPPAQPPAAPPINPDQPGAPLALLKRDVVDAVASRVGAMISGGELHMPPNYSAENAMKSAWLVLQQTLDKNDRPVLQVCTPNSIANSLLDMVVQGLNPAKKQCYFIPYGTQLTCQRSYMGTLALLKRVMGDHVEPFAEVVYEGDDFAYEIVGGRKVITKHVQSLANIDDAKILGAYCTIYLGEGKQPFTEIMTKAQILKAWNQGKAHGDSPAHKNFAGEMSKKTVFNRGCKVMINSSNDAALVRVLRRQEMTTAAAEMNEQIEAGGDPEELDLPGGDEPKALPAASAEADPIAPATQETGTPPPPPPPGEERELFLLPPNDPPPPTGGGSGSKGKSRRDW